MSIADDWALRRLAERYGYAVDRGDGDALAALFTPDGVLEGPTGRYAGREAIAKVPGMVQSRYLRTFHAVLNQVPSIAGGKGRAETYGIARHLFVSPEGARCYEMTIRYQDQFAHMYGEWRFAERRLIVDWTRTYPVDAAPRPTSQGQRESRDG